MTGTLIIGGSSYIGRPLIRRLQNNGAVVATFATSPISNGLLFNALTMRLTDVVRRSDNFNKAVLLLANSDPVSCWRDQVASQALNVDATLRIIQDLKHLGIMPVFLSSEAVYGGPKMAPFTEDDPASPQFLYARQKVAIEQYLATQNIVHLNIRLARVFGFKADDTTGLEEWINAIRSGKLIKCAADQLISPISLHDAVEGISRLIDVGAQGTYNLAGARQIHRISLLQILATEAAKHGFAVPLIERCLLRDFTMNEPRPLNSSMSNHRFHAVTGYEPASYEALCLETAKCFLSKDRTNG